MLPSKYQRHFFDMLSAARTRKKSRLQILKREILNDSKHVYLLRLGTDTGREETVNAPHLVKQWWSMDGLPTIPIYEQHFKAANEYAALPQHEKRNLAKIQKTIEKTSMRVPSHHHKEQPQERTSSSSSGDAYSATVATRSR